MYIRRTTIKSRKDGGQYYTYRLVESKRTEKGVRQHTLLNLGVDFSLPREQWPDLTKRIEEILGGQHQLFEIDSDIESLAQGLASRIVLSHQDVDPTFCERLSNSSETHQFIIMKNKNNGTTAS